MKSALFICSPLIFIFQYKSNVFSPLTDKQSLKIEELSVLDCSTMSGDRVGRVIRGNPSQYVKLNIGGSLHYTTIGTLTKHDTMLRAMFSGRMEVLTDSEGKLHFISYYSLFFSLFFCTLYCLWFDLKRSEFCITLIHCDISDFFFVDVQLKFVHSLPYFNINLCCCCI